MNLRQVLLKVSPYFVLAALFFALPTLLFRVESLEGKFLVATGKASDSPAFNQSIVYVLRHDWLGAEGVIVNKPGYGGPVAPETPYVFFNDSEEGLVLEPERPVAAPTLHLKGRAEWGYRQLGREVSEGYWEVRPYSADLVFTDRPEDSWRNARKGLIVPDSR